MKLYLLLPFFSIYTLPVGATSLPDTSVNPQRKEFKLNKEQFLERYGRDDSSRALIRYFFLRHSSAGRMILIPWGINTLIAPILLPAVINDSKRRQQFNEDIGALLIVTVLLGGLAATTIALSIPATVMITYYTRRKLLRLLNGYFNGKSIPRRYAKPKMFSILMKGDYKRTRKPHTSHHHHPNPFRKKKDIELN